jgi:hypothetical protein
MPADRHRWLLWSDDKIIEAVANDSEASRSSQPTRRIRIEPRRNGIPIRAIVERDG